MLQAEMGATLFYHPVAWRSMISQIKTVVSGGGTPKNKVKVGVNVNWEKICGCPSELIYSVNYFSVSLGTVITGNSVVQTLKLSVWLRGCVAAGTPVSKLLGAMSSSTSH